MRQIIIVLSIFILIASALGVSARPKIDTVVLDNGDIITCEIKELSRGKLTVKTDAMGTIYIEWADVDSLQSGFYYRVESSNGDRYFGSLQMDRGTDELRIKSASKLTVLVAANAAEITSLEKSFWQRNKGSLSLGYSYARSTDLSEMSFQWNNDYRTERNLVSLTLNATLKESSETDTRRNSIVTSFTRLLRGIWAGTLSLSFERNDELNLEKRILGSVLTGANPINNNFNTLLLSAGVAVNSELETGGTETTESIEWSLTSSYSLFFYNTPKTKVDLLLEAYPSITDQGRYRISFDATLSREIISDFFFDLTYYLDYDNKGSSGEGVQKDYGITTSLQYTY